MQKHRCDLCNKEIYSNEFLALGHFVIDVTCMLLFIAKMFTWIFYQSFKLGNIKNFPCVCSHKAKWHISMFKADNIPFGERSWLYFLFFFKFERDEKTPLQECVICAFNIDVPEFGCFEFHPINNLIYLESLQKKK